MQHSDFAHGLRDTVLYRWQGLLVSEHWFCAQGQSVPVRDLHHVTWRAGPVPIARRRAYRVIGAVAALMTLTLAIALPPVAAAAGAGTAVIGAAAGFWLSWRRWPRPLLLCASHRGLAVVLHASTDHLEFHKVYRALRRAAERQADHTLASDPWLDRPAAA
jgi:hypothetical protein